MNVTPAKASTQRTVLAFLGAPLIVPVVFYLPFPGESTGPSNTSALSMLLTPLVYSLYALPVAYIAEFLLGVPAWMVFRRFGVRSLPAFVAAGALMGWLVNLGMEALTGNLTTKPLTVLFNALNNPYISICIVAGASSAVLFRLIVFSGNQGTENPK